MLLDQFKWAYPENVGANIWTTRKAEPHNTGPEFWKPLFPVEKHDDELAALESWDSGKLCEQSAKIEIPMLVHLLRYYAGWADKIHGLTVPADGPYHVQTLLEPIGVAGQIIPWNFPLLNALYASKLFHEISQQLVMQSITRDEMRLRLL